MTDSRLWFSTARGIQKCGNFTRYRRIEIHNRTAVILPHGLGGRTTNQLIRHVWLWSLMARFDSLDGHWPGISEWGLDCSLEYDYSPEYSRQLRHKRLTRTIELDGNREPIQLGAQISLCHPKYVRISGNGLRASNLLDGRERALQEVDFKFQDVCCSNLYTEMSLDDQLVVHVRAGDLFREKGLLRRDMFPLPISHLKTLRKTFDLPFTFVGEFHTNREYFDALRQNFQDSTFLGPNCLHDDFRLLMRAKKLAISFSTFSWCAAWLSSKVEIAVIPLGGFFHPLIRPDIDLTSGLDYRFHFIGIKSIQLSRAQLKDYAWLLHK